jgi:WD40 repeat protein
MIFATVVPGQSGDVHMWCAHVYRLLGTLTGGHTKMITCLSIAFDNTLLATGSVDTCVILRNLGYMQMEAKLPSPSHLVTAVAFNNASDKLAVRTHGTVRTRLLIWDVGTRTAVAMYHWTVSIVISNVCFSVNDER